jgi:hypothetical protein
MTYNLLKYCTELWASTMCKSDLPQKPRAEIKWQAMAAKCGGGGPAVDFPPTLAGTTEHLKKAGPTLVWDRDASVRKAKQEPPGCWDGVQLNLWVADDDDVEEWERVSYGVT